MFLSTDSGNTWNAFNNGLTETDILSLLIDGTNLFAGTSGGGVFLSTNNGNNWTAINNGLTDNWVFSLAISGTNLFAGTMFDGVFLSTDNGSTWTPANIGLESYSTVFDFAINGSDIFAATDDGVFLSTNNGGTWDSVNTGIPINATVYSLNISGTNIFAGTLAGVFLSSDNGSTWTALNSSLPFNNVRDIALSGSNIFAGTLSEGIFLSTDNGLSWTEVNTGLVNTNVMSLAIIGTTIYAGTRDFGTWKRPLNEMITSISGTVFKSDNITQVTSGKVYLLDYDTIVMQFANKDSFMLNSTNGNYNFSNVASGNYLLLVKPNTSFYPSAIPTYFGNVHNWNDATILDVSSDTSGINIAVTETPVLSGPGSISGIIQHGIGTGKTGNGNVTPFGDPVPGIDISLEEIPGGIIRAHTETNDSGFYSFSNLTLNSTFKLLVDIPGLPMDSTYSFNITSTDTVFNNLDFVVDTTSDGTGGIYIGYPLGTTNYELPTTNFLIFPNPNDGTFTILVSGIQHPISCIRIYNVLGEIVYHSNEKAKLHSVNLRVSSGIYYVQVICKGILLNKKIVIE